MNYRVQILENPFQFHGVKAPLIRTSIAPSNTQSKVNSLDLLETHNLDSPSSSTLKHERTSTKYNFDPSKPDQAMNPPSVAPQSNVHIPFDPQKGS